MLVKRFDLFSYLASYHFFHSSFLVQATILDKIFTVDKEIKQNYTEAENFDSSFY